MDKRISIEGMSCNHCTARVQKALEKLPGLTVNAIDLQGADVSLSGEISDETLRQQVEDAGYQVTSIE
ncbi:cation transporter [Eubacteriales bacterium OttesenSCG-928-N13]|nr:cation transporter [Eubacteriales bacterium OttesenSCG-928-N13]